MFLSGDHEKYLEHPYLPEAVKEIISTDITIR